MRFEGTSAYVATNDLKVAVNAAIALERPLLVKGEPGTGKTVLAIEIAKALGAPLIEWHIKSTTKALQGLYEYDAVTRLRDSQLGDARVHDVRNYIRPGPLWRAFVSDERLVLLIDEIDKTDQEFEAMLLELLSDWQITIPELGRIESRTHPVVLLTSNNTRELTEALKRRCLYHWIDYPSPQREVEIVRRRVKGASETLAVQVAYAVSRMRDSDVQKPPGVAEAIDWVAALSLLGVERLDAAAIDRTLGSVLKYSEDQEVIRAAGLEQLVRAGD